MPPNDPLGRERLKPSEYLPQKIGKDPFSKLNLLIKEGYRQCRPK